MLRTAKGLHGYTVHSTDGEIGQVDDFLIDEEDWTVRYVVVHTGGWLFGRRVLLAPEAVAEADWPGNGLHVGLTRRQVEESPPLDADRPITRQEEQSYRVYFGWPLYWGGGLWSAAHYPVPFYAPIAAAALGEPADADAEGDEAAARVEEDHGEARLRSAASVNGYAVQGEDGEIGRVEDFLLDDETWTVRYLSVDTGGWLSGRKVLVPPGWVAQVSAPESLVFVPLPREMIRNAPEWDPSQPIPREYEQALYDYYRRPPYWDA